MAVHPEASDHELLAKLQHGDVDALDALIQRYWSPLVAYVTRLGSTSDAAEDMVQQTFARLWERRTTWRATGSVRGLLYRIAHNLAVSEHRAERARSRADSHGAEDVTRPVSPLDALEHAELGDALNAAIRMLPPRRREVFILRCVHELSYREIAGIMRTSPQTVANQLSRALATLRTVLRPLLDR